MGFRNNAIAKVWSVAPGKGNFTNVRLSISRKNKQTDSYEQDFGGYCMFIGEAHARAALLNENSRIRLEDVDVSNSYDKNTGKSYINYKVFKFSMADDNSGAKPAPSAPANPVESNPVESGAADDDDTLPW